jgi:hypothetical protein
MGYELRLFHYDVCGGGGVAAVNVVVVVEKAR